ncbi:alcohol dehydrogenase (plasmid) [Burkholderia sp. PAMC 26561]|nr:alcohol dehydrogenase [Burkholderia sp. PAMC 26561]AME28072.1 alcohol dehydrogenase [Burkholderia sp. PAMC 26561]
MRAYTLETGKNYKLAQRDMGVPSPQADEVLIRVHAAGLNYLDLMVAWGRLGAVDAAFVPGTDGAGEIVAVGERVRGWREGDRVIAGSIVDWAAGPLTREAGKRLRGVSMPGSLAAFAVVPATALVRIPDALPYVQAATLPIAATTAWNAIVAGNVRPGSTVALLGTGGVSLFALQFAKAAGARVFISSSSDQKLAQARTLGADETINYRTTPAWDEVLLAATDGRGADLVVETVGGDSFKRSVNASAIGGTLYSVGFVGGMDASFPLLDVMAKTLRIIGSQTGSTANLADAVRALAQSAIEPVIDRVFPFSNAQDAYAYLEKGGHFGKVVIDVDASLGDK